MNHQTFRPVRKPAASMPDAGIGKPAAGEAWRRSRLGELEETFPEPVIWAGAELEAFRAERL